MRYIIINALLAGLIGGTLGHCGIKATMWEYWAIFGAVCAIILNTILKD